MPDARVEYDLWTTPADAVSRQFLNSFEAAAVALADDAYFTPRMYIYDGNKAGCYAANGSGENYCLGLCTNAGRYCATDPDGDLDAGVSGVDVIAESLRRICIWNTYGAANGVGTAWWKYVKEFMAQCDGKNDKSSGSLFTDPLCIAAAMKVAGVDKALIDTCMVDSGGLDADATNALLESSLNDKETSGAFLIPSLFVNKAPVRGTLSFSTVFKAVCAGYAAGSEPAVCKACSNCRDEASCVKDGACKSGYDGYAVMAVSGGVSSLAFATSMLGLTLLFAIVGYIVYQRQQRRMRDEVRGILAEYMPVGSYVYAAHSYEMGF